MKRRMRYKKCQINKRATTKAGMLLVGCLLIFGSGVHAAAGTLQSPSAVIYEAAEEGSGAIGNVVQGNTFEVLDSSVAGDGSRWYHISLSNGARGYIKGDVSMEGENEAGPAQGENGAEPAQGENGAEPAQEENEGGPEQEENGAGAEQGENNAEPPQGEADAPEAEIGAEGSNAEDDAMGGGAGESGANSAGASSRPQTGSNTQAKNYSIKADADRIRAQVREADAEQKPQASFDEKIKAGVDKTLFVLLGVTLLSVLLIGYCCRRLKRLLYLSQKHSEYSGKSRYIGGRNKKRRKAKRAKKKRMAKEAKSERTTVY